MNLQFHIALDKLDPIASYLDESAKANDLLTLEGPVGSFVLNENSPNPLIFVAEGIGFASIKGLIEHAMALDVAEKIFLFWLAGNEDTPYLHNLCRSWNDALDNFEYVPLAAAAAEHLDDHILDQLKPNDPSGFDYYICGGDKIRGGMAQFTGKRAIPKHQVLFEAL
jgi:CDP-4-dehydro-6-deoxyglucose reductase